MSALGGESGAGKGAGWVHRIRQRRMAAQRPDLRAHLAWLAQRRTAPLATSGTLRPLRPLAPARRLITVRERQPDDQPLVLLHQRSLWSPVDEEPRIGFGVPAWQETDDSRLPAFPGPTLSAREPRTARPPSARTAPATPGAGAGPARSSPSLAEVRRALQRPLAQPMQSRPGTSVPIPPSASRPSDSATFRRATVIEEPPEARPSTPPGLAVLMAAGEAAEPPSTPPDRLAPPEARITPPPTGGEPALPTRPAEPRLAKPVPTQSADLPHATGTRRTEASPPQALPDGASFADLAAGTLQQTATPQRRVETRTPVGPAPPVEPTARAVDSVSEPPPPLAATNQPAVPESDVARREDRVTAAQAAPDVGSVPVQGEALRARRLADSGGPAPSTVPPAGAGPIVPSPSEADEARRDEASPRTLPSQPREAVSVPAERVPSQAVVRPSAPSQLPGPVTQEGPEESQPSPSPTLAGEERFASIPFATVTEPEIPLRRLPLAEAPGETLVGSVPPVSGEAQPVIAPSPSGEEEPRPQLGPLQDVLSTRPRRESGLSAPIRRQEERRGQPPGPGSAELAQPEGAEGGRETDALVSPQPAVEEPRLRGIPLQQALFGTMGGLVRRIEEPRSGAERREATPSGSEALAESSGPSLQVSLVQRQAEGTQEAAAPAGPDEAQPAPPQPDMDALAEEVYRRLRERLRIERERMGGDGPRWR